jgi:polyphosphate kinase
MTTDPTITTELIPLFDFLKKNDIEAKAKMKFEKLLVSQFNMYDRFVKLIDAEKEKVARGEEALIRIKINNLEEPEMITHLYKASQAGVKIYLIVRSVCCLVPGVAGLSDNIIVRRLVDRYLEHTRLFIFGAGDTAEVIMGSADWMNRNLHSRIEVCVSISNADCKKELIDYFEIQWSDNDKMTELTSSLEQHRIDANGFPRINAQQSIYHYLQESQ